MTDSTAPAETTSLDDLRAQYDELHAELGALTMAKFAPGMAIYGPALQRSYDKALSAWCDLHRTLEAARDDEQAAGR